MDNTRIYAKRKKRVMHKRKSLRNSENEEKSCSMREKKPEK